RPAVAGAAEVGVALHGAGGERARRCVGGELGRGAGDVEDCPVPEPAAGRRIRIEHREDEALGARRWIEPAQLRRHVLAGAAEAVEDLRRRELAPGEVLTLELERTGRSVDDRL